MPAKAQHPSGGRSGELEVAVRAERYVQHLGEVGDLRATASSRCDLALVLVEPAPVAELDDVTRDLRPDSRKAGLAHGDAARAQGLADTVADVLGVAAVLRDGAAGAAPEPPDAPHVPSCPVGRHAVVAAGEADRGDDRIDLELLRRRLARRTGGVEHGLARRVPDRGGRLPEVERDRDLRARLVASGPAGQVTQDVDDLARLIAKCIADLEPDVR